MIQITLDAALMTGILTGLGALCAGVGALVWAFRRDPKSPGS